MKKKIFASTLGISLILTGCNPSKIETPNTVIEKALSQNLGAYEIDIDYALESSEYGGFPIKTMAHSRSEGRLDLGSKNIKSEKNNQISLKMEGFNDDDLVSIGIETEIKTQLVDSNFYASFKEPNIKLEGETPEVQFMKEKMEGIKPWIKIYAGDTFQFSSNKMLALTDRIVENETDYSGKKITTYAEQLKTYLSKTLLSDMRDTELIKVTEDMGIKSIKTKDGRGIKTYHYRLGLTPEGIPNFLRRINQSMEFLPEEDAENYLSKIEGDNTFIKELEIANEQLFIQVWIGADDYHPYKFQIELDLEKISSLEDETDDQKSEAVNRLLMTIESHPIDSFKVEIDENPIDLSPTLETIVELGIEGGKQSNEVKNDFLKDSELNPS